MSALTGASFPKPCEHLHLVDCKTCGKTYEQRLREMRATGRVASGRATITLAQR